MGQKGQLATGLALIFLFNHLVLAIGLVRALDRATNVLTGKKLVGDGLDLEIKMGGNSPSGEKLGMHLAIFTIVINPIGRKKLT